MSPRLELRLDDGARVELPASGVLSIGSARGSADLVLEGPGVAAVHCVIGSVKGGGYALKDLGSPAGTRVNGRAVSKVRLKARDRIELGARAALVVDPAAAPEAPATAPASPPAAAQAAGAADALPSLRGYRIERRLGRGGMGAVFLAVQESLERRVALKVLDPRHAADQDFVRRFQAEARAAAALSHPNVVTVHDVWEEQGHHWLAMEFMERGNLEDRLARSGPLPPDEVVGVLCDAARGLVYAELRGIVHRDIKPANLMQDGLGHTKIADLGLAAQLDEASDGEARVFGTPHFVAPEQARGEPVDGRADLYALGATAYRLITGRTPFEGVTTRELVRAHLTERPAPPSTRVPGLSPALDAIVLRLMEKDPARRHATARELLEELERLRGAGPVATARAGGKPAWIAAAALLALAAAAGWYASRTTPGDGAGALAGTPRRERAFGESSAVLAPSAETPEASLASDGSGEAPLDDDSALKALEREAQAAYDGLPPDLLAPERAARLAQLAEAYAGTTEAARWREEVATLETGTRESAGERSRRADEAAADLSAIAALGARELTLGGLASALSALAPANVLGADPVHLEARARAQAEVLRGLEARARAAWDEADRRASEGDFQGVAAELEALAALLAEAPPAQPAVAEGAPTEGPAPLPAEPLDALRALRERSAKRLAGLGRERELWRLEREHEHARTLASELSADGPLAVGLRRLELRQVAERLDELAETMRLPAGFAPSGTEQYARAEAARLAAGARALDGLVEAFGEGEWRRRSILDPRPDAGRRTLSVVGAERGGISVDEDGHAATLAWRDFALDPDALDQLFHQRLGRDYTADELAGIAALVRVATVQALALAARDALAGGSYAPAGAGWFDAAQRWAEAAGQADLIARERAAARRLEAALEAAQQGAWSTAVARTEALLAGARDTLLVRMISDGSPWLAPPPEPEAAEPPAVPASEGEAPQPGSQPAGGGDANPASDPSGSGQGSDSGTGSGPESGPESGSGSGAEGAERGAGRAGAPTRPSTFELASEIACRAPSHRVSPPR